MCLRLEFAGLRLGGIRSRRCRYCWFLLRHRWRNLFLLLGPLNMSKVVTVSKLHSLASTGIESFWMKRTLSRIEMQNRRKLPALSILNTDGA